MEKRAGLCLGLEEGVPSFSQRSSGGNHSQSEEREASGKITYRKVPKESKNKRLSLKICTLRVMRIGERGTISPKGSVGERGMSPHQDAGDHYSLGSYQHRGESDMEYT